MFYSTAVIYSEQRFAAGTVSYRSIQKQNKKQRQADQTGMASWSHCTPRTAGLPWTEGRSSLPPGLPSSTAPESPWLVQPVGWEARSRTLISPAGFIPNCASCFFLFYELEKRGRNILTTSEITMKSDGWIVLDCEMLSPKG